MNNPSYYDVLGLVTAGLIPGESVIGADCPTWTPSGADGVFGYSLRVRFEHPTWGDKVIQFIDVKGWYAGKDCVEKKVSIEFWEWFVLYPVGGGVPGGATKVGVVMFSKPGGGQVADIVDQHEFPDTFFGEEVTSAYLKLEGSYGIGSFSGPLAMGGFGVLDMPVVIEPAGLVVTPNTTLKQGTGTFAPPISTWTETYHYYKKDKCCNRRDVDRVEVVNQDGGVIPME